jgi:hypothetical protein
LSKTTTSLETRSKRATTYIERMGPAIEGHGGDLHTFRVAIALVRGFSLPQDAALTLMTEWNATCRPPWTDRDLVRKLKVAAETSNRPLGYLLREEASRAGPLNVYWAICDVVDAMVFYRGRRLLGPGGTDCLMHLDTQIDWASGDRRGEWRERGTTPSEGERLSALLLAVEDYIQRVESRPGHYVRVRRPSYLDTFNPRPDFEAARWLLNRAVRYLHGRRPSRTKERKRRVVSTVDPLGQGDGNQCRGTRASTDDWSDRRVAHGPEAACLREEARREAQEILLAIRRRLGPQERRILDALVDAPAKGAQKWVAREVGTTVGTVKTAWARIRRKARPFAARWAALSDSPTLPQRRTPAIVTRLSAARPSSPLASPHSLEFVGQGERRAA